MDSVFRAYIILQLRAANKKLKIAAHSPSSVCFEDFPPFSPNNLMMSFMRVSMDISLIWNCCSPACTLQHLLGHEQRNSVHVPALPSIMCSGKNGVRFSPNINWHNHVKVNSKKQDFQPLSFNSVLVKTKQHTHTHTHV